MEVEAPKKKKRWNNTCCRWVQLALILGGQWAVPGDFGSKWQKHHELWCRSNLCSDVSLMTEVIYKHDRNVRDGLNWKWLLHTDVQWSSWLHRLVFWGCVERCDGRVKLAHKCLLDQQVKNEFQLRGTRATLVLLHALWGSCWMEHLLGRVPLKYETLYTWKS